MSHQIRTEPIPTGRATRAVAAYRLTCLTMWLAPRPVGAILGMTPPRTGPATYLARLFLSRGFGLGVGILTSRGAARRRWVQVGVGVDAVDLVSAELAARAGHLDASGRRRVFAASGLSVLLGVLALAEGRGQD